MMEDKCPFCGAIQDTDPCNRYIFTCRTEVSGHTNSLYLRSHICYEAELAQVKAQLAERETRLREAERLRLAVINLYETMEFEVWAQGSARYEETAKFIQSIWEMIAGEGKSFLTQPQGSTGEMAEMVCVRRDWLGNLQLIAEEALYKWTTKRDAQNALNEVIDLVKAAMGEKP